MSFMNLVVVSPVFVGLLLLADSYVMYTRNSHIPVNRDILKFLKAVVKDED